MGMTIDDCISKLTEILEEATEDENSVCYVTDVDEPTLKTTIDTMRKYQKIKEKEIMMGMTIDIAIQNGIDLIDMFKKYFPSDKAIYTVSELVEIATRYQKIKEQVDIAIDNEKFAISNARLIQIREIIDGNDD